MSINLQLFLVIFISSIIMSALGIPMWLGKVKPNRLYGFRTRLTLENPDIWYAVNEISGRLMTLFGLFMAAASVPLLMLERETTVIYLMAYAGVYAAGMIAVTVKGMRLAKKMKSGRS